MKKISFDIDTIKFISLFESLTHASVKDCIVQDQKITFIVSQGEMGKAIGKKGLTIKKLEQKVRKKIRIIEHDDDLVLFVAHVFYPNKASSITEEDGVVTVVPLDNATRGFMIGRGATYLRFSEDIVKRYFDIKEIKVV